MERKVPNNLYGPWFNHDQICSFKKGRDAANKQRLKNLLLKVNNT